MNDALTSLTRKPDRAADRAVLDGLLDEAKVGTLSTVVEGLPWSVPLLYARLDDTIVLHGSTGAGALRHVAAGAPVTFTVFVLDALVVADTLFNHSANYRSAVLRGVLQPAADPVVALEALSDKLVPGRVAELSTMTGKEVAATLALELPIVDGQWIAKARTGGPGGGGSGGDSAGWTGIVPVRTVFDDPITSTGDVPPSSVRALTENS